VPTSAVAQGTPVMGKMVGLAPTVNFIDVAVPASWVYFLSAWEPLSTCQFHTSHFSLAWVRLLCGCFIPF
jgi:hypothetical protein